MVHPVAYADQKFQNMVAQIKLLVQSYRLTWLQFEKIGTILAQINLPVDTYKSYQIIGFDHGTKVAQIKLVVQMSTVTWLKLVYRCPELPDWSSYYKSISRHLS